MMNKRALVSVLLIIAIVIIVIMSVTGLYYFRNTGASLTVGNIILSADYEQKDGSLFEPESYIEEVADEEEVEEDFNNIA